MMLEDTLAELGHEVVAVASRVATAMQLAQTAEETSPFSTSISMGSRVIPWPKY